MSIGADQGGSVRIPACNCGIVGLKPTFGLIPYTGKKDMGLWPYSTKVLILGCASNEPSNDNLGVITRSVGENALLLQNIAGADNIDDRGFAAPAPERIPKYSATLSSYEAPKDLTGIKVGIIAESLTGAVLDPRVKSTFLKAAECFRQLGATVSEVSIPLHNKGPAIWTGISKVGGFLGKSTGSFGRRGYQMVDLHSMMWPLQQQNWDNAYVSLKNNYLNGAYATKMFPHLLGKATNLSRMLRDAYDAALSEYDVLITPTLPYIATSHCAPDAGPLDQIAKQVGLTSNTCQFNQTGHPALTMPIGMLEIQEGHLKGTGTKLPVGLQIVGKWWAEETVYRVAYAWELANPNWKD
ncbi:Amidase [Lasiodiplodia hormozganensis]|uniref:Amidase n=1 Tax=Lasiodiplodia hormozganensis TaxID=869390 RepID=A0AA40D7S7_9PEZI|nr:Amidase [Lasiodiplodia hormozganensis]